LIHRIELSMIQCLFCCTDASSHCLLFYLWNGEKVRLITGHRGRHDARKWFA
jgi:hypothetical protein